MTALCLPAVAHDALVATEAGSVSSVDSQVITQVHKLVLGGSSDILRYTAPSLERHMRTLVAAGLFVDEAEARRGSLQLNGLLAAHTLEWYIERRVAVLEAGGTSDVVRAACAATHGLRSLLARLLLYKFARCVLSYMLTSSNSLPHHRATVLMRCDRPLVALLRRGGLSIRSAVYETRLTEKFGANGVRGDLPSFKDYIKSKAGQRELHAWQQRIHAQVKQELSSHLTQLAPGVNAA